MNILVYNVAASESGALAILNEFYNYVKNINDIEIKWYFLISTPHLEETENIKIINVPFIKKSWFHRLYFELFKVQKFLKLYKIDKVFSMQNVVVPRIKIEQVLYLHQPIPFVKYKFRIRENFIFWIYQNIIKYNILFSINKAKKVIVQTKWMKNAICKMMDIKSEKILVINPTIDKNIIREYEDNKKNRTNFFYPATSLTYKNHKVIISACKELEKRGIRDYRVIFTIDKNDNELSKTLYKECEKNKLNIEFNGKINRDKVMELYSKSSLIFPSYLETFGLPLLEARLSNSFIISSRTEFAEEILNGYENSVFFEKYDYIKLSYHMEEIIKKKEHKKKLQKINNIGNTWDRVYEQICN